MSNCLGHGARHNGLEALSHSAAPLVTVVAVCYNHSKYVVECLESIRQQTYSCIQLIVMDDASPDESVHIIEKWIEGNAIDCLFIRNSANRGICRTLNEALGFAKGKYVSIVSADDVLLPDKLRQQVAEMEELPENIGVLYSEAWQMDVSGNPVPSMFIESQGRFRNLPDGDIFSTLVDGNFIPALTTLIRRSCFETVGVYDERLCYEDWDMWLRIAQHFRFASSAYVSARYRIVPKSLTWTRSGTPEGMLSDFTIAYKLLQSGRVCGEQAKLVRARVSWAVEALCRMNYSGRHVYLWRALRYPADLRTVAMATLSLLGIPYPWFCAGVEEYGRIKRWIARL